MKSKHINPFAAIDALMALEKEPVGPEWFTKKAFMDRYDLGLMAAQTRLRRLTREGTLEEWIGICSNSKRRTCKYRILPAKTK